MLLQFSIKNFRTFKDRTTLSLFASNYDKDTREEDNINYDDKFNLRLVKSAVVYGANASGKSKLFDALSFMKDFVINSSTGSKKGDKIPVHPFRLNSESLIAPSEFEVIFTLDNVMYRYGFDANKNKVIAEWLYYKPKTKEIELFYRDGDDFDTHRSFSKGNAVIKGELVRDNALLLSVAAQFNDEISITVIDWFQELEIISALKEQEFKNNTIEKIKNNTEKIKILKFIKAADLGIQDIEYKEFSFDGFNNEEKEQLKRIRETIDPEMFSDLSTTHRIYDTLRKNVNKTTFSVSTDESNGTRKFLYLSGTIIDVLEKGNILFIDELDTALHPNLVCKIVELFNSKEFNKNNAQLVFNTHDTNLLSSGLFRRDQIWFTEKNKFGEAKLYSLADFKSDEVRKTDLFEENYIRGKYGAIPFLGFFDNLNILTKV